MAQRPQQRKRAGTFGRLVRGHRERLRLTMNELARTIEMDQGLLSKIERGKRPPPQMVPHVQRIAEALGFKPDSAGFKELMEAAYRERFGKKQKWPQIISIVLGEHGTPEITRTAAGLHGLGAYAPPETRETIHPDSHLGRRLDWRPSENVVKGQYLELAHDLDVPYSLVEFLSRAPDGAWVLQICKALPPIGVRITRFEREGESFTLEIRLRDGTWIMRRG